jgi:DNA-binding response OmpR family regulator
MSSAAIRPDISGRGPDTVLLLEQEVLIRASIADYLRSCGYRVLEARSTEEALRILQQTAESIRVVLSDAENGFRLSGWIKANRPKIKVVLAATAERAAEAAAGLCDSGPQGRRPYDPQLLVQQIKAHLAKGGG